ncbi:BON domain-containing protein [Cupriavidus lacunae]|uniref:Transporter n=1 Tax=Cupriavidus lacunae TaxID=2666307 RepID=A0A370NIY8_9BURK|nr:BON domain-containing protein [Cupriavidus lacunae]RDK05542.1 transporter [Cupriavidus lacunae]
MFNFRNDRGRPEAQRRERSPAQRMRDESRGSGSEDWGQEWGEDWRGERGGERRSQYGGYESRSENRSEEQGRDNESARHGGTGHPYSSGYGGYRNEERESGYGYRDEDRFGPRGRRGELSERDEDWDERGGRAMHWREGSEHDRAQRGGQPSYGGGYFGDAGSGGQSYSGGQRVYPDDPGYRRRPPYAAQAGASGPQVGQHVGRRAVGPKGYRRSDERVREDVCERLAMNPYVDVGEVSVEVANGVVTLDGTVRERREKYVVEEIADAVFGVTEVDNHLRVQRQPGTAWAAGSEVGGDDSAGASGAASASGTSPDRTLNKS